jgi:ArsR family transcriptional regulator
MDISACCPILDEPLGAADAERVAGVFRALADPTRVRILSLVAASPGGEACVCNLVPPLGLAQPTVSHHLKVLTEAGLLRREKRGTWAWFRLDHDALRAASDALTPPRR